MLKQKGFSLVEVLLGSALLGGVALAGLSLFKNQNAAQKTIEGNFEVTSTLADIRGILASRETCTRNLLGKTPTTPANVFTSIIKTKNGADITPPVYPVTSVLPGTTIKINSYSLSKAFSNLASDETLLVISFMRGQSSIKNEITKTVKIKYNLDGSGRISNCNSVTGGTSDSLWQIAPNLTDIFYSSGNVGIRTSMPLSPLHVNGDNVRVSHFGNEGPSLVLQNNTKTANGIANAWHIYNMTGAYGNSLQFWAYDTNGCGTGLCNSRMTIMDTGSVSIGTMMPGNSSKLHVYSSGSVQGITTENPGGTFMHIRRDAANEWFLSAPVGADELRFQRGNLTSPPTLRITTSGLVYVDGVNSRFMSGMPGNAGATGPVCYTSGGIFDACSSLKKFKTNIKELDLDIHDFMKLKPVTYQLKDSNKHEMGFIAEDMEKLDKRYAQYGTNGKLTGVKYEQLTSLITKVVQDLFKENEDLKSEVQKLKSENEEIKQFLCQKNSNASFCRK